MDFNAGLYSSKKRTKFYLDRWCRCWKSRKNDILLSDSNTTTNNNNSDKPKNDDLSHASSKVELRAHSASKTTSASSKEAQTPQSEESSEAEFSNSAAEKSAGIHPGRAHFASVALSVQAFIALKRIVKEKMEIKRRKHRHLQRMTIAITLTFLLCWMPYHILPYVTLSTSQFPKSLTCTLDYCVKDDTLQEVTKSVFFTESNFPLNIVLLWSFVLLSITSIANPCLYSFSREKIRNEFSKIFCKTKNVNVPRNGESFRKKSAANRSSKPINTKAVLKWKKKNHNNSNALLQSSSNFVDKQKRFEKSPASTRKFIQIDPFLSAENSKQQENNRENIKTE